MGTGSRHRRPFPHGTVVPAFVVLASTAATAAASPAGFPTVARSTAFATASAGASSIKNRHRTTRGASIGGSSSSSSSSSRLNSGSGGVLESGLESASHPARVRGVRRRRTAGGPTAPAGRQRSAALFPPSRLTASPTALPEDTNSTPASSNSPSQPSAPSSDADARAGGAGVEAERGSNGATTAAAAAAAAAVEYSVLCPALDGADDGLLALSLGAPSSAAPQLQRQGLETGRAQPQARTAEGAAGRYSGKVGDLAVPPPASSLDQRWRGGGLASSSSSPSSDDASAAGGRAGSEPPVLRRGARLGAEVKRSSINSNSDGTAVEDRVAAAPGPGWATAASAAVRANGADEVATAREAVGLEVVAVGQGQAAGSTASLAMGARPLGGNARGEFGGGVKVGGAAAAAAAAAASNGAGVNAGTAGSERADPTGNRGGGGRGGIGKKATKKRQRSGAAAFPSAEDRGLRELLVEAIKTGRGGAALRALRLMVEQKVPVSQKQYVGAMEACMRQGSWTSGLEVFRLLLEDLRPRGLSPKQSTWKSLAKGLRAAGQADQGVAVLRQALKAGVRHIDEQVCSILLDLCAVKGRMGLAEEIASLMETHRIPKGPVTYCVLLKGYGRQRRLGGVEATMREMKERGVAPDVVALNAAVDAFVRCGELPKARKILASMEQSPGGSLAQTLTYNTLIKGLGRELRVDEAFDVARGMLDRGCIPNEVTINSLVDICVRSGDLDRAYRLLKNPTLYPSSSPGATAPLGGGGGDWAGAVDKVDVEVEIGAADMVDSPWGEGGDEGGVGDSGYEAEGVAVEVEVGRAAGAAAVGAGATGGYGEAEGGAWRGVGLVRPSVEAFTSVLTGFAGVGDKDRALAVFQQMVTAGVEPNVVTYTGLISACVNAGDMEGARRLFSALEARGAVTPAMQPSSFTYNTLIRGLCRMAVEADPDQDAGSAVASAAAGRSGYETNLSQSQDEAQQQEYPNVDVDVDVGVGVYTDQDLLLPGVGGGGAAAAGEDDPASAIISKPGFFYEKGSPPSEGGGSEEGTTLRSSSSSSSSSSGVGAIKGASSEGDDDVGGAAASSGVGSPAVDSPPGILTDSADGGGGGGSGSALPDGIQEALRVLLSMRRRGVPVDEVTMNSIIDGLVSCSPPRVREAETVLALMSGWGLKPNQVSFTVMLKGYGRIGDLGAAELMFELMANDRDQRPDVVALNSILDACVRNGDLRRAVEILEKASAAATSKRAVYTRHEDWIAASSSKRPWGASAGPGAVALCVAAAPGSGIGLGTGDDPEEGLRGGTPIGVMGGPGRRGGRAQGVMMDVWPNQVSFATVVLGLSRRGDAPAGRKAIKLYESMRRDFKFLPDEGMVDSLVVACCNAQAAQTDGSDLALAQGQEALNELRDLGWDEELIVFKEQVLMRVVPTLSEVWKEGNQEAQRLLRPRGVGDPQNQQQQREGGKAGATRKRKVSAEIFEKYGWNKMESHFPIL